MQLTRQEIYDLEKVLESKPNETAEEGWERKAKVLGRIYQQLQKISLLLDEKSVIANVIELIEEFNQISIEEK